MSQEDKGITKKIREKAYEIIKSRKDGIRYSELTAELRKAFPDYNWNTINAQVAQLRDHPDYKNKLASVDSVGRIYKAISSENEDNVETTVEVGKTPLEKEFYDAFADYLVHDLKECTIAKKYGVSQNKRKWSNPDVVGIYKLSIGSAFKRDPEIVCAEIKTTGTYDSLREAFSQAAFYLLFSHKTYIVVPNTSNPEALDILESLSTAFGIGLVLFDPKNKDNPNFTLRNKAQRHEPDIEYLNDDGLRVIKFLENNEIDWDIILLF